MNSELNDSTYLLYCAQRYDGRFCPTTEEFQNDMKRITYIKKLITRYVETGDLKERLILNHIIVLNNVFGADATCRILWFKLEKQMKYIKPFLILLNILPSVLYNINGKKIIITDDVDMDSTIIQALRKI